MWYDDSRHGYLCEQCRASKEIFKARGCCGGPLNGPLCGGDLIKGRWTVDCGLAIGDSASHLGNCTVCPIAEIEAHQNLIHKVFVEYQAIKRLGIRNDSTIPSQLLIAIDDEIERMRARDLERSRALDEARLKARKNG